MQILALTTEKETSDKLLNISPFSIFKKAGLMLLMLLFVMSASASHFRFGNVTATRISETATTVTYRINTTISSRNDFIINSAQFSFSGGNSGSITIPLTTYLDPSGEYTTGNGTATVTFNKSATPTKISFFSSAKLSTLINNHDLSWDVYTIVNTNGTGSTPVSSFPAVIDLPAGMTAASYQVPASDPDAGTTLSYAFPSFTGNLAGQSEPPTFAVNSSTGVSTMNTVGLTIGNLYNALVTVTDQQGNQILLDFIIRIVGTSNAPTFIYGAGATPAAGTVYNIVAGQNISFNIRASDIDGGDLVHLNAAGLSTYITTANFSPALPATANPAQTTFSWTPSAAQVGTQNILNFVASDNAGVQTTSSVTINVVNEPAPVFQTPTPGEGNIRQIVTGAATITDQITASSSIGSNVSIAFATVPAGATLSPTVPTPGANPASTTMTWTPTASNFGDNTLQFQAIISGNNSIFTTRTYHIIANSLSSFTSSPVTFVTPGQTYTYNVVLADADIPFGDIVGVQGMTLPAWLTLTPGSNGHATLSGSTTVPGTYPVVLHAEDTYHDGNPGEILQSFNVTVANFNAVPPALAVGCTTTTNFAINPVLTPTPVSGQWYPDRKAPNGFVSNGSALIESIVAADGVTPLNPNNPQSSNNTQGRTLDTKLGTNTISVKLFVPAAWQTAGPQMGTDNIRRMAGFWPVANKTGNTVQGNFAYPIIEFVNDGTNGYFRAFNTIDGTWVNFPTFTAYNSFVTLTVQLSSTDAYYTVQGQGTLSLPTDPDPAVHPDYLRGVILQGYNSQAGLTYDITWDDLISSGSDCPTFSIANNSFCFGPSAVITASGLLASAPNTVINGTYTTAPAGVSNPVFTGTTDASGNLVYTSPTNLPGGHYVLHFSSVDLNGNVTAVNSDVTFDIGQPTVDQPANVSATCSGITVPSTVFTSSTSTTNVVYNWTNSNTAIGLAASGTGNVPAFTATNPSSSTAATATITVTPVYTNGATVCTGASKTYTITVFPTSTANIPGAANTIICAGQPTSVNVILNGTPTFNGVFNIALQSGSGASSTLAFSSATSQAISIPAGNGHLTNTGTNNAVYIISFASVTDGNGCAITPANLTGFVQVTVEPVADLTATRTTPAAICSGGTVSVTVANPNSVGGTYNRSAVYGAVTHTASSPAPNQAYGVFTETLTNATNAPITVVYTFTPTSPGTLGCNGTPVNVSVTVNPLPAATISGSANACQNATAPTVTFTGSNSTAPYTFTYNINGGASQTVVSNGAGVATVAAPTTASGTFTYNLLSVQDASSTTCSNTATGSAFITVFPSVPVLTAPTNTCNAAFILPTVATIAQFTTQFSIDGGTYATSPTIPTTTGCHTVKARYVLTSAYGSNAALATAPAGCLESATVSTVIYPTTPAITATANTCGTMFALPTVAAVTGFSVEYSLDGAAYTASPSTTTAGCHTIAARYVLTAACGGTAAGAAGPCANSNVVSTVIFPTNPVITVPSNTCNAAFTLPSVTAVTGFTVQYSIDGGTYTSTPTVSSTPGCHTVSAQYVLTAACGGTAAGATGPCGPTNTVSTVIFPTAPVLTAPTNTCNTAFTLPAVTTVAGFTTQYSIDGGAYTATPVVPATTGCHTVSAQYVLTATCGTTLAGATGSGACGVSNTVSTVIYPTTPAITATANTCGTMFALPTVAAVTGFSVEYSLDGGAYTASPSTTTAGCHTIAARYVLTAACGGTAAGAAGPCANSNVVSTVIYPTTPAITATANTCGTMFALPTVAAVTGFSVEYSLDGAAYTASPSTTTAGCHTIAARYVLTAACGNTLAGAAGPCANSNVVSTVIYPTTPAITATANTCGTMFALPTVAAVTGFSVEYSLDGAAYTASPSTTTAGCHTIAARYVLTAACGGTAAGAAGPCANSNVVSTVIYPTTPAITATANTCATAFTLPTVAAVSGFTVQYSIDGGTFATAPSTTTPGCHTIAARYVLTAACGNTLAGAAGPCANSNVVSTVIYPTTPAITATANTCGTMFALPTVAAVTGFSVEYSLDGAAYTASPSTTTAGCHTIAARYVLTAACGGTAAGAAGPCANSNVVSTVIFPTNPVITVPSNTCNAAFTLPSVTAVTGFTVQYSIDGGTYTSTPTVSSIPGCHTVSAQYVLTAACGGTAAGATGPCGPTNTVSTVIFPTAPVLTAPTNTCNTAFTLPAVTTVAGFTTQYSIDGGAYTATPVVPATTGCHTVSAQYVLTATCGTTLAGATGSGACGVSNTVSTVIYPTTPAITATANTCGTMFALPTVAAVTGFSVEYSLDGGAYTASPSTTTAGCHTIAARYVLTAACGGTAAGAAGPCANSNVVSTVIYPTTPAITATANTCGTMFALPTVAAVTGFSVEYSLDGAAYTASPSTTTAGCHTIAARYVLTAACGNTLAGAAGPCANSNVVSTVIYPTTPAITATANTCGTMFALPTVAAVTGFSVEYSLDGAAYTASPSTTTAGCHTIAARYVLTAACGGTAAGAAGPCANSNVVSTVIYPTTPAITATANTCATAFTLPTVAAVSGFTVQYSIDGGTFATAPSTTTPGCHTIAARYVLTAACGNTLAGAAGPCANSNVVSTVIYPTTPAITATANTCGTMFALPTVAAVTGFSVEYSLDGAAYTASPSTTTAGCHTIAARYVLTAACGGTAAGAAGPCANSNVVSTVIYPTTPAITATANTCGTMFALPTVAAVTGFSVEYSLDGAAYTASPSTTTAGCHTIAARYVLTAACGGTAAGTAGSCANSNVVSTVIYPTTPAITATANTCGTMFALPTVAAVAGFSVEYSLDGGAYTANPSTTTPGCHTIAARYVLTAACGGTAAGAAGPCANSNVVSTLIYPTSPTITAPTATCNTAFTLPTVASVTGFTTEYSINGAAYSANPTIPTTPGTYTIQVRYVNTAACGNTAASTAGPCPNSNTVTTYINPIPQVDQPADQLLLCNKTSTAAVVFTTTTTGPGVMSYTWTNSNTTIGLAAASGTGNIPSFLTNNPSLSNVNSATFVVTPHYTQAGVTCDGPTKTFTISVQPGSTGQITGAGNTQICAGTDGSVNINLGGVAPFNGHFVISVVSGPGTGTPSFAFTSPFSGGTSVIIPTANLSNTSATPVIYRIQFLDLFDANGCLANPLAGQVQITVNPLPIATATPSSQTICSNTATNIVLTSTIAGTTYTYTAAVVGGPNAGVTGFSDCFSSCSTIFQTIRNTTATNQVVRYTITPTTQSAQGCQGPDITVDITVRPEPVGTATPATAILCSGQTTNIVLSNQIATGTTYTWTAVQTSGGTVTGFSGCTSGCTSPVQQTLVNTSATPGVITYTFTGTSANGCVGATFTSVVTINPAPVGVATPATSTICSKATTSIALSNQIIAGGVTYTWTASQTSGTGTVTGFSNCTTGCGTTIAQQLFNTGITSGTITYVITPVSANGCPGATFTATVTVNPAPAVTNSATATTCSGTSPNVTLTSSIPSTFTYTIGTVTGGITGASASAGNVTAINQVLTNPSNTLSGTVQYIVTPTATGTGCVGAPFTITVTVNPAPAVTNSATATTCSGTSPNVTLTSSIPSTFTYTIGTVTGGITGASASAGNVTAINQVLTNPSNTLSGTVQYIVTPTATGTGCVGAPFTITVTVNPAPAVTNSATATTCSGTSPNVTLTSSIPSTFTYTIGTVTGGITGASASAGNVTAINQVLTNPSNTLSGTVQYIVTPTATGTGCVGAPFTITVTVNPAPAVTNSATATTCSGTSPNVTLTSSIPSTFTYTIGTVTGGITGASASAGNVTAINQVLTNPSNTLSGTVQYIVTPTATGTGCVGAPFTITVTVNPAPAVTNSATATTCSGTSPNVTLTSSIPSTFTYTIGTVTGGITGASASAGNVTAINQVLTNPSNTLSGTVQYIVTPTATGTGCVGAPFTITVTVNPAPAVTNSATATTCSGTSPNVTLTSSIPSTFTYTIGTVTGGITGASASAGNVTAINQVLTNPSNTLSGTVQYIVTPTATGTGCVGAPFTITVTVNPAPVVTNAATAATCSGTSPNVTLTSSIPSTFTYTIGTVTGGITGASASAGNVTAINQVLTNPSNTLSGTVQYIVTPTATGTGCVGAPFTITVTVNPAPAVTNSATATTCSGTSPNVTLTSSIPSTFTYTIGTVTGGITGASASAGNVTAINQVLTNPSNTLSGTVQYIVTPTATGTGCVGAPFTITVTVNPAPAVTNSATATTCSGTSPNVTLTSSIPSTFTYTIGTVTGGITGASASAGNVTAINQVLTNPSNTLSGTVQYIVTPTATGTGCVGAPFTITVTVNPAPAVTNSATATTCSGTSPNVTLTSSIPSTFTYTIGTVTGGITGASASAGNVTAINQVLTNPSNTLSGTVQYIVTPTATGTGCVGAPFTITVTVNPAPAVTNSATATTCSGTSPNVTLTSSIPSTFTYTIGTVTGGITGASASAGNVTAINQVLTNPSNTLSGTVQYIVTPTATGTGCVGAPFTITVTVNPKPVVTNAATAATCSGTSPNVTLTASTASTFTYIIGTVTGGITGASASAGNVTAINQVLTNPSNTASGTVQYIITPTSTPAGCVGAPFTITVTVNPAPAVTNSATATTCSGTSPNVTLTSSIPSTFTYTIGTITGGVTGASNSAGNVTAINQTLNVAGPTAGTVQYIVTPTSTANGCVGAALTITVTVNPAPAATISGTTAVCQNSTAPTVTFTGSNGTAPYTFTYTLNGGSNQTVVSTGNTATITAPTGIPGTFTYALVSVRDASSTACLSVVSGQSAVITVTPIPVLVATRVGTGDVCPGSNIVFNVSETNGGAGTFSWVARDAANTVLGSATGVAYGNGAVSTNLGLSCPYNNAVTFTFTPTGSNPLNCAGAPVVSAPVNVRNIVKPTFTFSASLPTTLNVGAGTNCTVPMPNYAQLYVTGISNCGGTVALQQLAPNAPTSPVIGYGGTRTIVIRGTDACGNTADTSFIITLVDATAPTPVCQNITVNLNAAGNATVVPSAVNNGSTDNCSGTSLTYALSKTTFDCSNVGPNTVTLTVTDQAGNSATCTSTITIMDVTAPVISCFGDTTIAKGANCTNTMPDLTFRVTKSDACGFNANSVTQSVPVGTVIGASITTLPVTLTVTDKNGNSSQCTFNITFNDQSAPIITTCAAPQSAPASASCSAAVPDFTSTVIATDNCTGAAGLTITQSPVAGTIVGTGTTVIMITVKDAANNTSTCSTSFTVADVTAPTITACAANQSATTNASCQAAVPNFTTGVTATDNCTASNALVITQSPAAGTLVGTGTFIVTISVKDAANNTSTCTATFTVTDVTAPTITTCAPAQTGTTNATCQAAVPNFTTTTIATDNCTAAASLVKTQSPAAGTLVGPGVTTVTITVKDASNNTTTCTTTFTVSDATAPTITTCAPAQTGTTNGTCQAAVPNFTTGVVANDNCTAAGSLVITQSPAAGTLVGTGVTTVTITVKDAANNATTCTTTFTVSDVTAPTITTCAPAQTGTTNGTCQAAVPNFTTGVVANDNCTAAGSLVITQSPAAGTLVGTGVTTVTITVKDAANNTTTCTTTFTVSDVTAPVITACAPAQTGTTNGTCQAAVPNFTTGVVANDNCTAAGSLVITQSPAAGTLVGTGVTTVTITVKDAANNTTTCTTTFTVSDVTAPVITACAPAQTGTTNSSCQATVPSFTGNVTATDNCTAAANLVITQSPVAGTLVGLGVTTVTITVKDAANNTTTCTTTFTVTDVTAPVFSACPPNITAPINAAGCSATVNTLNPTATDNCSAVTLTYTLSGAQTGTGSGNVGTHTFPVGVTTVTYRATDAAGNFSLCSYTVTVVNNLAATISGTATVAQNTSTTSNVTFSATGGTGIYTFTYNVSVNGGTAGAPQTISTTGTNTIVTVPQSNAVNGTYKYTLLSVTDNFGCAGTVPTAPANAATITIVTTLPQPDFTTALDIDALSLPANGNRDFVIYVSELKGNSSTGQLTFRIPKSAAFTVTYGATNTTSNVSGGTPNQNADWTITENASFVVCQTKPGVTIGAFQSSIVGFKVTRPVTTASNTTANITATIQNGTGGDSVNANNSSVTQIVAQ